MLKFDKVSFSYPQSTGPALRDITFDIAPGESVAVVGGNGSGKTTLALLAAGVLPPSSGRIECDSANGPRTGLVLQNPDNQVVSISVERELAFPLECRQIPTAQMRTRVDDFLRNMGFEAKAETAPSNLSGGEKQKLALGSAIISNPSILVLDEPTSHLDRSGKKLLNDAIDNARRQDRDLITILVTQSTEEAMACSRLIVLQDGTIVADGKPDEILSDAEHCRKWHLAVPDSLVIEAVDLSVVGREPITQKPNNEVAERDDVLLTVTDLAFAWEGGEPVFSHLDFELYKARITGFAARSGGGKSTLGYLLGGLAAPQGGEIRWQGESADSALLLSNVSYLFQFPERQFFCGTVYDEIAFGLRQLRLSESEVAERVGEACDLAGLDFEKFRECSPFHISGGEMRKVAIASIIALQRPLIIFDEPTAELDSVAVDRFRESTRRIRAKGVTQLVISHDTDFLFSVCDNMILLSDGSVAHKGDVYGLLDVPGVFDKCALQLPRLIQWSIDSRMGDYVKSNKIRSVSELAKISKLTS